MKRPVATFSFMNPLPELTTQNFDHEVLEADVPVLVDFTAPWCAPCRALTPILHALATEGADRLRVATVDGDAYPDIAARFRVKAFPTVIAFHRGKEIGRQVGLASKERFAKLLAPSAASV
jgi:thioredoxin 1